MSQLAEKIRKARKSKGYSQQEMAELLNVPRSSYAEWEKSTEPKASIMTKIAEILEINFAEYSESLTSNESSNNQSESVAEESGNYIAMRRLKKNKDDQFYAPFLPIKARAGYTSTYDQITFIEELEKYAIPPGINPAGAQWMYFEIEGDSMLPELEERDTILASMVPPEDWQELRNFYVYVIVTETQLMVKRVFRKSPEEWVLISDNEAVYGQVIQKVEEVKELWVLRRLIKAKVPPPKMFEIKI